MNSDHGAHDGTGTCYGPTARLAAYALEATFETGARTIAVRALLDTVGVMVAGTREPEIRPLLRLLDSRVEGPSTAIGMSGQTAPSVAALLNGVLAHLLDYDDVSHAIKGHPSAVLVPTVLALGEALDASGHSVLDAYLAGFQVAAAIAAGLGVAEHYRRGWHATSTIGTLAATGAACRLLGVDLHTARNAFGIAASFAAGSRQNFGSTTKSLHVGKAAETAIQAATLAQYGATADPAQLEGPLGYFSLLGPGLDDQSFSASLLGEPAVLRPTGINVKKHPCCYNSHRAVDAALETYPDHHGADIEKVDVTVEPGGTAALVFHRPNTGLEAKFSGEYVLAAALLDGALTIATFRDDVVRRPDIQALLRRITLLEAQSPPFGSRQWSHGYATVEVLCSDGRALRKRVDVPRGDARRPLSDDSLRSKFLDCLSCAGIESEAGGVSARIMNLVEDAPVVGLLAPIQEALLRETARSE